MEQMLERIKERVAQRDSPIKTVKSLINTIGMSEAGFYTMIKRGTTKPGTLLAIADALKVEPSFLDSKIEANRSITKIEANILESILQDMQEMKEVFEEQLRTKDRQIDGLQRTIDVLVGKSKGAIVEPASISDQAFDVMMGQYKRLVADQFSFPMAVLNSEALLMAGQNEKSVAPRSLTLRTR